MGRNNGPGMSGSYPYREREQRYKYLSDVFRTLVVRDIKKRHKIRNSAMLDRVADFLTDNIANVTSSRNIAEALTGNGPPANHKTVGAYIGYLCDAFAFYQVKRYDIRGKKYLSGSAKYHLADHAFKYALLGTRNMDWGQAYENMVAVELLRRGYEVYAGVLYKTEVDFVAIKRSEKLYSQVADDVSSEKTLGREVTPLLKIRDAYPKTVLARTRHETTDRDGVQIVDLARWLAGEA